MGINPMRDDPFDYPSGRLSLRSLDDMRRPVEYPVMQRHRYEAGPVRYPGVGGRPEPRGGDPYGSSAPPSKHPGYPSDYRASSPERPRGILKNKLPMPAPSRVANPRSRSPPSWPQGLMASRSSGATPYEPEFETDLEISEMRSRRAERYMMEREDMDRRYMEREVIFHFNHIFQYQYFILNTSFYDCHYPRWKMR